MEALNRQEVEDLVVDLYCNQKKTFREVQKMVRKSPRDIKAILNRVEPEHSSLSISSQAYRLFSEGKSPTQVAIVLNIREPEATQFYREFWKLDQLYNLNHIYEETKGNFSLLVELYRQMMIAGINVAHVIRLLRVANNDLPSVEYRCQELKRQEASLLAGNSNAARIFQELSDGIAEEQKILDQYRLFCKQQKQEINKILLQKTGLEEFVECFQNRNDAYLKIKETIKQEIECALADPRQLLKMALVSLIESSRKDPRRFYALSYNMDTSTILTAQDQSTIGYDGQCDYVSSTNEQSLHPYYSDNDESYGKILLNESEKFYNKIIDDITGKTINSIRSKSILSLQPETQPSQVGRSIQKLSALKYRKEEHTFIQSEIGNEEDQDSRI